MNYIKDIFKVSILLLILLVCLGSIYASDDDGAFEGEEGDMDEFELEEDLDDDSQDDLGDDEDLSGDEEEEDDGESDEEDDDLQDDEDDNISDEYAYSDFDYLKMKITFYLDKYGNYSSHNWTESDEFLSEYQIYLANPENYTLNESAEGYKTYLKIYDSVTSTFGEYNLTENETAYLKFMVIFYLNHYGNVSANYTWNESDSFENFTIPWYYITGGLFNDWAKGNATCPSCGVYLSSYNPFYTVFGNSTDVNQTAAVNQTVVAAQNSFDFSIFVLLIVVMLVILIII